MLLFSLSRAASATVGAALLLLAAEMWSDEALLHQAPSSVSRVRSGRQGADTAVRGRAAMRMVEDSPGVAPSSNRTQHQAASKGSNNSISVGRLDPEDNDHSIDVADGASPPATDIHQEPQSSTEASLSRLLPMRTCRSSSFPIPNKKRWSFELEYQCNGTEYEQFAARMRRFANNVSLHSETWGRRPEPFPSGAAVLFLGNSHTKQTALELVCQYSDQIKEVKQRHRSAVAVTFTNGAQLYLVQNSPVEMAVRWTDELEKLVMRPLRTFQAVVLGQFNGAGSDVRNTSYYQLMKNWSDHDADGHLQFGAVEPPSILQIADEFAGPIVFVSNYDRRKVEAANLVLKAMDELRQDKNRTNLAGVMARAYIERLEGNECGTDWRFKVGDCGPTRSGSHRCVGAHGGHPTLVAHDVQEALYSLLVGTPSAAEEVV